MYIKKIKSNVEMCTTPVIPFSLMPLLDSFLIFFFRGDIFRIENPSVWQISMFSQILPMGNMGKLCAKRL
jgi:hypothetical protein